MTNYTNTLYYGDNLKILRKYIPDESVDLIYLDPPFNSKRAYAVFFKDKQGGESKAQIQAFEDTWSWNEDVDEEFGVMMIHPDYPTELKDMLKAFKDFMGKNNLMAYLTMMAVRLVELRRVLKDTGSIYLHCDPTASHYLKIVMDQIFGTNYFRNEILWKRSTPRANTTRKFPVACDTILFYSKSQNNIWNNVYGEYRLEYIEKYYSYIDETERYFQPTSLLGHQGINPVYEWKGLLKPWRYPKHRLEELEREGKIYFPPKGKIPRLKRYLDKQKGKTIQSLWDDIPPVNSQAQERLGYPTQKPLALLERIIQTSSNEGDVIMDPFCGCGTAIAAAEKLGRQWIGIDITHLAVALMKKRLSDNFHLIPYESYDVIGEPESVAAARELAEHSKSQFEFWAVSLVVGQPFKSKGGGDSGIDGLLYFKDYEGDYHRIIIEVKGGGYTPTMVKGLKSTMDRENEPMGILIALKPPTKGMLSYAASLGTWQMPGSLRKYPVLQFLTIEDYFKGIRPDLPDTSITLKKATREIRESEKPQKLDL